TFAPADCVSCKPLMLFSYSFPLTITCLVVLCE
ncbi:hypothetical protein D049_1530B, partial [Vibrio parahaemolyticus VPTS-2010]